MGLQSKVDGRSKEKKEGLPVYLKESPDYLLRQVNLESGQFNHLIFDMGMTLI